MSNQELIMTIAIPLGAVISAFMQMIKTSEYVPNKYIPLATIVIGMLVGVVGAVAVFNVPIVIGVIAGCLAGLSAGGFYNLASTKSK